MPTDRILVVDDEETIREIVCSMLTSLQLQMPAGGFGP